jgi:hypothetical protein
MWSSAYWQDVAERCAKTAAQSLIALWGAGALNLLSVDWISALGVAAGAAVLSVLTSIVSLPVGAPGSPSLLSGVGRHEKP